LLGGLGYEVRECLDTSSLAAAITALVLFLALYVHLVYMILVDHIQIPDISSSCGYLLRSPAFPPRLNGLILRQRKLVEPSPPALAAVRHQQRG
jgi:hypothetical protein